LGAAGNAVARDTAAVALLVIAGPLTATLLARGRFNAHDVAMTSYALMSYSWACWG